MRIYSIMNSEEIKKSLIDPKVITSVGGILLAGMAIWGLIRMNTNDMNHMRADIKAAMESRNEIQKDTNEILRDMTGVIERNTQVIQNIR